MLVTTATVSTCVIAAFVVAIATPTTMSRAAAFQIASPCSDYTPPVDGFAILQHPKRRGSSRIGMLALSGTSEPTVEIGDDSGERSVTTTKQLEEYFEDKDRRFRKRKDGGDTIDYDSLLSSLYVEGDTQIVGSTEDHRLVHPVVKLVHERKRAIDEIKRNSPVPQGFSKRVVPPDDGCKVALAVEGGGMRGCLTAGMVAAIHHLGLEDTVDVVYGSSAGTVIGSYFITRQLPWFGPELYYDSLTTAGSKFINSKRFLRAVGLGFLNPYLIKDTLFRRNNGKPVLNLSYLLEDTMQRNKPLDWERFKMQQEVQPLKVMASGLKSGRPIIMDFEKGSFSNLEELGNCMRASCLLPGVAGPVMNLQGSADRSWTLTPMNGFQGGEDCEPMADSLLYAPIPYQPAIDEGATHVICLRSRPDGTDVSGRSSFFEKMIVRRFLLRKNGLKEAYKYMKSNFHKKLYAKQVLELNEGARDMDRPYTDTSRPHLLPIAVKPGSPEVSKLETGREAIFEGVRRGFARCYDSLVEDPEQRGRGMDVARQVFPDQILEYDPLEYTSTTKSAFRAYLESPEADPEDIKLSGS